MQLLLPQRSLLTARLDFSFRNPTLADGSTDAVHEYANHLQGASGDSVHRHSVSANTSPCVPKATRVLVGDHDRVEQDHLGRHNGIQDHPPADRHESGVTGVQPPTHGDIKEIHLDSAYCHCPRSRHAEPSESIALHDFGQDSSAMWLPGCRKFQGGNVIQRSRQQVLLLHHFVNLQPTGLLAAFLWLPE